MRLEVGPVTVESNMCRRRVATMVSSIVSGYVALATRCLFVTCFVVCFSLAH